MHIELAYGKRGLTISVPKKNLIKVLTMKKAEPVQDTSIAITNTLLRPVGCAPLFDIAKDRRNACILICDITRPVPNKILLPPILKSLHTAGIQRNDITILIATGIHRPNLGDELIELVGEEIADKYRVQNHYSRDLDSHKYLGKTSRGTEVWIDKRYCEANFKIATGFIEPHLMAGFSGGRKLVVPGVASIETMKYMHGPKLLEHPNAREGVMENNPFHEEAVEIARMAGLDFIVNVALNEKKEILGIFSGEMETAHAAGVDFVQNTVRDTVPEPVDIVITTSAGYPLDKTYYQAIKGMTAAAPIVKEGGTIIIAAKCDEGIGGEEFTNLVYDTTDLTKFIQNINTDDYFVIDQWMLEEYARAARKAEIILISDGLSSEQKNNMHIKWADSVDFALKEALKKHGTGARIAVIPKGPYILADLESM